MEVFFELTSLVLLVAAVSIVMRVLRQPLVIGYIITGILASPFVLDLIHSKENIELFAEIGITVLLFIVGLHLNPKVIKEFGKISLVAGLGQIVFTCLIATIIMLGFGTPLVPALYIGIALTFSSTIIIMKVISDKDDSNRLYGQISIGILLIQDLVAIFVLMGVSSLSGAGGSSILALVGLILLKGAAMFVILYLLARYVLHHFSRFVAASQELLLLFSLAWGLGMASIFSILGFSLESGALVAGVSLAATPFADNIASRLKSLRDFFIVLFFILLGAEMKLDLIQQMLLPAVLLSVFVIVGKPIIVFVLMNLLGYKRKTSFQSGLTMAQVSEFSFILMTIALSLKHIDESVLSLVTLVGVITIGASSYLMLHADTVYHHVGHWFKLFEFRKNHKEHENSSEEYEVLLFGFDRVGHDFINSFKKLKKQYLVVDYNPALVVQMKEENIPFKFGDAEDVEFLHELQLDKIKMVVSTIPDVKTSRLLLKKIRSVNPHAVAIVLTHDIDSAKELYMHGATYVIMPHYLGARHASDIIARHSFDLKEFEKEKEKHLEYLEKRS